MKYDFPETLSGDTTLHNIELDKAVIKFLKEHSTRSVTVINGAMASGKTHFLIKLLENFDDYLVFKPGSIYDYSPTLKSRSGFTHSCVYNLTDFIQNPTFYEAEYLQLKTGRCTLIAVDEFQFATPEEIEFIFSWKIEVVLSGLRTDYLGREFPVWKQIEEKYNPIKINISNRCECGNPTQYNIRFVNGSVDLRGMNYLNPLEDPYLIVPEVSHYKSVCKSCFKRFVTWST